jgi:hypothetical protein
MLPPQQDKIFLPRFGNPHEGVPTSSLLRWPRRYNHEGLLPQATTKASLRFPLRIKGWYKHFGALSQMNQHGQPRRTSSRLGFQEPKSSKHKQSRQNEESECSSRRSMLPLSNLMSLAQTIKDWSLKAGGEREWASHSLERVGRAEMNMQSSGNH